MSNTKTPETVREFMLKKFPTNEYMDCPVPKEYWPIIQEYSSQQNREYVEALRAIEDMTSTISNDPVVWRKLLKRISKMAKSLIRNEGK